MVGPLVVDQKIVFYFSPTPLRNVL